MKAAIALLLLSLPALAQSPPLEFKGIPLGLSEAHLLEKHPGFRCNDNETLGRSCTFSDKGYRAFCQQVTGEPFRACIKQITELREFGPTNPSMYLAAVRGGVVLRLDILFPSQDFEGVAAALREKYGKPSGAKTEPVTNRMGATFDNRLFEWVRHDGTLRIEQRGTTIDQSMATIVSPDFLSQEATGRAEKAKAAAKKL